MKWTSSIFAVVFFLISCQSTQLTPDNSFQVSGPTEGLYSEQHLDFSGWGRTNKCCVATGTKFAVASAGERASEIGAEILRKGGNVVDASVATALAIAVERPFSAGLGGGGFMTLHMAKPSAKNYFFDFRETAPHRATKNMFLDGKGRVIKGKSTTGVFAVATPGLVAGLFDIHERFGKLPWKDLVLPAAELARKGFKVYPTYARVSEENIPRFKDTYTRNLALPGGKAPKVGETFVQNDLADTLEVIAAEGKKAFYQGKIAKKILQLMRNRNGLISEMDLASYQLRERFAIPGRFGQFDFISAPPPSAGGVMLVEMFNVLSLFDVASEVKNSPEYVHLLSEMLKRGYADRSLYIGDPDFIDAKHQLLLRTEYAYKLKDFLNREKNTPSAEVAPYRPMAKDHGTAHWSIMDANGNAVSGTMTINDEFGSAVAVPGTGIFLNNEMDDFSAKPGEKNIYGLTGSEANAIAPGKRPASSMTPTILFQNGKPFLSVGAAGGSRIITSVFQTVLNYLFLYPSDLKRSIFAPRFHQQWLPDQLDLEEGFTPEFREALTKKGHELSKWPFLSNVQGVARDSSGTLTAVFDPRSYGGAVAE